MIVGALLGFIAWGVLGTSFFIGYKVGQRNKKVVRTQEEIDQEKRVIKHYDNLMNYDPTIAYRKRVE